MSWHKSLLATAFAVLAIAATAGCSHKENSLLRVNYNCSFSHGSTTKTDEFVVNVSVNLGSGRAMVGNFDAFVEVEAVPDKGELLLRYPWPNRTLIISPDGKAVLTQPSSPRSVEISHYNGKCEPK